MSLLVVLSLPHLAAVRKKEDPILKTQTDPIAYKQKMEEIKDGEKGAASPSMERYPESEFLSKTPVGDKEKSKEEKKLREEALPDLGEPIPEDLEGAGEEFEWEEWSDEEGDGAFLEEEDFQGSEEGFKEESEMDVKST